MTEPTASADAKDINKQGQNVFGRGVMDTQVPKTIKPTLKTDRPVSLLSDYERYGMMALNRLEGYQEPGAASVPVSKTEEKKQEPIEAKPLAAEAQKLQPPLVEDPDKEKDIRLSQGITGDKWAGSISDEALSNEYNQSVFDHIQNTKVTDEVKKIVEGVISKNNVVYIGGMYDFKHDEFLKTLELAHKLNDREFTQESFNRVTHLNTNELAKKDTRMIKKHLYDTRTSVYFPFISVCGRSFTTQKQFVEMVAKDRGKHLVESLRGCKEWADESGARSGKEVKPAENLKEIVNEPIKPKPVVPNPEKKPWIFALWK